MYNYPAHGVAASSQQEATVFFGVGPKYPVKIFTGLFTINNSISWGAGMSTHVICFVAAVNSVIFGCPPC